MIIVYQQKEKEIERRNIKFNKRNCLKVAYDYDAKITKWEPELLHCVLRDNFRRLIFLEGKK